MPPSTTSSTTAPGGGSPAPRRPAPSYWQRTAVQSDPRQIAREPKAWQRFILAEFLACLVMIAASMILIPATGQGQGSEGAGAGRSYARELVQLTAVCLLFFILALAGGGARTGKVAAAFGGLVTLGVAWHLSGIWSALAAALGPAAAKKPAQGQA